MTIHKVTTEQLNSEHAPIESRPFSVGVSFNHDLYDLGETVLKTRAIQAFENAATRYAIHRLARCSVRRRLTDIFDDLALKTGLAPQRLGRGSLLLDGPGVFVDAEGRRKSDYSSCTFNIWAETRERAEEVRAVLLRTVGERLLPAEMFVIDWHFTNAGGDLRSASFEEVAHDVLHDEAYPTLGGPVSEFVQRYVQAGETVLVLQGPPGSGKTRLVRAILAALSRRKGESAEVMYTADKRALKADEIFVDFITGTHDAFVIEDADHMLMARTDGNQDLHRFLAIADGVVRAQGRKIIFTTNLPNISDLDDALRRPGRCFAVVRTRSLTVEETERLVARLCGDRADLCARVRDNISVPSSRTASVAAIYRACSEARATADSTSADAANSRSDQV